MYEKNNRINIPLTSNLPSIDLHGEDRKSSEFISERVFR